MNAENNNIKSFIDTNLLVYLYDSSAPLKKDKIKNFLENSIKTEELFISTQVISEFYNVAVKKLNVNKTVAADLCRNFYDLFPVAGIRKENLLKAMEINEKYNLSYWDSLIISVAIACGCSKVYSEDMASGQNIEGVKIVNPFNAT